MFDTLVQVLVFGAACEKILDITCSDPTLRRRPNEWIDADTSAAEQVRVGIYDEMTGRDLQDLVVDGCIVKARAAGKLSTDCRVTPPLLRRKRACVQPCDQRRKRAPRVNHCLPDDRA